MLIWVTSSSDWIRIPGACGLVLRGTFCQTKNSVPFSILQTMANASFSLLELLHSANERFLDRYMIGWPSWDTTAAMARSLASIVKATSFLESKNFVTGLLVKAFFCFCVNVNSTFFTHFNKWFNNIVLNICLSVVAFLSLTFITSGQPEKEPT